MPPFSKSKKSAFGFDEKVLSWLSAISGEIWSAAKDETKLREIAKMIRQNWDAVKAKIEAKGSTKEVTAFESLVAKTDAAKISTDYAKLATPILDEVDNLEKVFS